MQTEKNSRPWTRLLLTLALCALVILPRVIDVATFVAFDETFYWERSNLFFTALLKQDWAATILDPRPAVTTMWVQAVVFGLKYTLPHLLTGHPADVLQAVELERPFNFAILGEKRLAMALTNSLALLLLCWSLRKLLGEKAALVATVLLALNPFLLSDSRTMRSDALMSVLMCLSVTRFLLYLREGRRSHLLLSSFFEGLAALIKVSSYSVAIFAALATAAYIFSRPAAERGRLWRRGLLALALWGVAVAATFWLLWPAMWVAPDKALGTVSAFAEDLADGRKTYFVGRVYTGEFLPFFYLLDFLMRSTPLALIGFAVALWRLALALYHSRRGDGQGGWWQRLLAQAHLLGETRVFAPTAALATYAFIFGAVMTVGALRRDHYLMPTFVAADVVAAVGLLWLGGRIWQLRAAAGLREKVGPGGAFAGGLALVLALQGAVSLPNHPYYYTYWNPLFGGGQVAPKIFMIDWGPDLAEAARYLNALPDARSLKVASATDLEFEPVFAGKRLKITTAGEWVQADYVLIRLTHLQMQKHKQSFLDYLRQRQPEYVVNRFGFDYCWLYPGLKVEHYTQGAHLEGEALLFGYKLNPEAPEAGSETAVWLIWQKENEQRSEMYLRLVDSGGYEWARAEVVPLPGFEQAAQTDDAFVESQARLKILPGTPPGTYFLKIGVRSSESGQTVGEFTLPPGQDSVQVKKPTVPPQAGAVEAQHRLEAPVGQAVELLGYDLAQGEGETLNLALYWRALKAPATDYVVAVRLVDAGGREAQYWLGRPVRSGYPTDGWSAGEIVKDPWDLTPEEGISDGEYTLEVELFDAATGGSAGKTRLATIRLDGGRVK